MFTVFRKRRARCTIPPGPRLLCDASGTGAVEFALLVPVMTFFVLGTFVLGMEYNNFVNITNAAQAGTFQLTLSKGTTNTPWTDTKNAVAAAAPALKQQDLTVSLAVNNAPCTSDTACKALLDPSSAKGQPASVTVSYPCHLPVLQIGAFQLTIPGCPRTTKSTGRIQ